MSTLAKEFTAATRIMKKLFERIEHSGIRYGIKCIQANATTLVIIP